jgi:hypothetical protein
MTYSLYFNFYCNPYLVTPGRFVRKYLRSVLQVRQVSQLGLQGKEVNSYLPFSPVGLKVPNISIKDFFYTGSLHRRVPRGDVPGMGLIDEGFDLLRGDECDFLA